MKKLIYLMVLIVILGLIVSGCLPVVPPIEQDVPGTLPSKSPDDLYVPTPAYPTIQAAIDAAEPGDTIHVAAGTYDLESSIRVYKPVSIIGDINNPEDVVINAETIPLNSGPKAPDMDKDGFQVAANDVVIRGFKIINAKTVWPLVKGDGWQNAGITVGGDITLIDWLDPWNVPILIDGGTFSDNIIEDCSHGIYLAMAKNVTVSNNIIRRSFCVTGREAYEGAGIINWNTEHWGTYQDPTGNVIEGNIIEDCERIGICLGAWGDRFSVAGSIIRNNTIRNSGVAGISLMYIDGPLTITGNDILDNLEGISILGGAASCTDISANFNNIVGNTSYGINNGGPNIIDATYNWWGHPGGPRRPAGNSGKISGPKDADQVSENVLYHPWLNDEFEWQPTDVGGLVLWLDAGSIKGADGRPVGSWQDSSGQGNHAKQDDSTKQPIYIASAGEEFNNQPTVRFDGSNDWMYAPYESTLTEKTMFVVARFNSLGNSSPDTQGRVYVMGLAQINSGWHTTEFKSTNGKWRGRTWDGSGKWVEGSPVLDGQWKLLSLRAVNNEVIEFWEEGTSKGTKSIGIMWTDHNIVAIGANGAPVGFFNGDIAEILIFDRALSNHERQRIEQYLKDKYSI